MEILKEGYGYKAGAKMRFIKNRNEGLSHNIPEGSVGKLAKIHDHGGNGEFLVIYLYNPLWVKKFPDGMLSFWTDEVEII